MGSSRRLVLVGGLCMRRSNLEWTTRNACGPSHGVVHLAHILPGTSRAESARIISVFYRLCDSLCNPPAASTINSLDSLRKINCSRPPVRSLSLSLSLSLARSAALHCVAWRFTQMTSTRHG